MRSMNSITMKEFDMKHHVPTLKKNDLEERKIGDIMDKGMALLTDASLPKNLWGFSIMTAICLINRLP